MSRPSLHLLAAALGVPLLLAAPLGAFAQDAPAEDAPAEDAPAEDAGGTPADTAPADDGGSTPADTTGGTPADTTTEPGDTTTTDPTDPAADTFSGNVRIVRIVEAPSTLAGVLLTVDGDDEADVVTVEVRFEDPIEGPAPSESSLTLLRTGTGYDSTGALFASPDLGGGPVLGASYDLNFTVEGFGGAFVLSGVPVGEFFAVAEGAGELPDANYRLASVDWSLDGHCLNCPIVSLVDLRDPADPDAGRAPGAVTA